MSLGFDPHTRPMRLSTVAKLRKASGVFVFTVMSRLLIDERPLVVLPSLARAIGLARALIVQQLHWRLNNQRIREINGVAFISDTYAEWPCPADGKCKKKYSVHFSRIFRLTVLQDLGNL